jgi:hypothetical protein
MPKLLTIGFLIALTVVSCGFSDIDVESSVGTYRGEPVRDVIARLGRPIRIAHSDGRRLYYWYANVGGDNTCKIWGAAEHGIILNWGYQSCAF